jgi:hypothetical protein
MPRKIASKIKAIGRLKVIWGIRLPCTVLDLPVDFSVPVKSLPQTRQRLASSLTRVPHVGQSFVGLDGVSDVIINILARITLAAGIIPVFYFSCAKYPIG